MANALYDGDAGFTAVNDRLNPALLPGGTLAKLVNGTLEFGDIRPRWGISSPTWGNASSSKPLALGRHRDPSGDDYLVLVTDEARASDGGHGRAWKISAGTSAVEIPLNGHDVWGTTRLVSGRGQTVLLRHGNARWYWTEATTNFNMTNNTLTLNTTSGLYTGDKVTVHYSGGSVNPIAGTDYWIYVVSSGVIKFATTRANALAGTAIDITSVIAGTALYLEKIEAWGAASSTSGTNQTGPVPLVMAAGLTAGTITASYTMGFSAAPVAITAQITNADTEVRAPNHNFWLGDCVRVTSDSGGFTTAAKYYVNVLEADRLTLHTTETNALLGTNPIAASGGAGPYTLLLVPDGYSILPMPGGREGVIFQNRLLLAASLDSVAVSDPGDFLHFEPYAGALTVNLGESTALQAIVPLSEDIVCMLKEDTVLAISGLSSTSTSEWRLTQVTQEYGCIAPLTAVQVGGDIWFLSRAGVASVLQTEQAKTRGAAVPVSQALSRKFLEIDWANASQAAAEWFNNRYLLAVPLRGQTGTIKNNCVFVYNFLNQGWEGYWTGDTLDVVDFARLTVNGQLRLCFASSDGQVRYFEEEALSDGDTAIALTARTRGYMAGFAGYKQWHDIEAALDTWYPTWTMTLVQEGVNETHTLVSADALSRTAFFKFNAGTRTAGDTASLAEDYAILAGDGALAGDSVLTGQFQSVIRRYPLSNVRDRMVQLELTTTRGSVRCKSVMVRATADQALPTNQP